MNVNPQVHNRKRQRSSLDTVEHPGDVEFQQPKRRRTERSFFR